MATRSPVDQLDALRSLLETASGLVEGVASDPARDRFLRIYERIPLEDRSVLLDVFAREVSFRVATLGEGEAITGCGARPNPNARLYLRVLEKAPDKLPTLDHDQMVFSNLRSARIMRLTRAPDVHDRWRAASVEAFGLLDAGERAEVQQVLRELLEILETADRGEPEAAKASA